MPSINAKGSKVSRKSSRGRRLMYLKSGPRNCFFKFSHKSFRWGEESGKYFRGDKVCVPEIGSADLLFHVNPQIPPLGGGAKWQILSWGKVCVGKIGFGNEEKNYVGA